MKQLLFFIALIFAWLFVTSTLFGFCWNLVGLTKGESLEGLVSFYSYSATGIGLVGWIVASLSLVLYDEFDGVNFDDELDVTI